MGKPQVSSGFAQSELDKADEQFKSFDKELQEKCCADISNANVPKEEVEQQTKMSSREMYESTDIYLQPSMIVGPREPFNEKYRADYEYQKEYVRFIAEHREIIGETIETWTKKFAGINCEFWKVPTNKPVWGPRYLANQISACCYKRKIMADANADTIKPGILYGNMISEVMVNRIDAFPAPKTKSIFVSGRQF